MERAKAEGDLHRHVKEPLGILREGGPTGNSRPDDLAGTGAESSRCDSRRPFMPGQPLRCQSTGVGREPSHPVQSRTWKELQMRSAQLAVLLFIAVSAIAQEISVVGYNLESGGSTIAKIKERVAAVDGSTSGASARS